MPCIYALMMMTILVISKIFPVRFVLYLIKALYYPKKVLAGMKHAGHVLPGNFLGQHYFTFELLHHLLATLFALSFWSIIKSLLELRDFQVYPPDYSEVSFNFRPNILFVTVGALAS